ncbi:MAG: GGDEF domain-containing protein [Eubacteriaceae bacterium]|nr:GGDEF domain-containing protein [Eubacteriaceae bacterium]
MSNYYFAIVIMTVTMLVVLSLLINGNRTLSKKKRTGFHLVAALIIIAVCSEFMGVLLNGTDSSTRVLHIAVKCIELSIAPAIPIICGLSIYPAKHKWAPMSLIAINFVLELLSAFYGFIYFVDAQNVYHHCAYYGLYYIAYTLGTIYLLIYVFRFSSKYQNQKTMCLATIVVFIFAGIICQAIDGSLRIVWLTVAIGFSLFYIYFSDLILQIDVLTGLLNRGSYDNKIESVNKNVTIMFFDIDHFNHNNDTYGHSAGDKCLKAVSAEVRHAFGKIGLCYRFGGDEFCVITNRRIGNIEDYISAFLKNMDNKRKTEDPKLPYVSIGYADHDHGDSIDDAVWRADRMMYEYKRKHRLNPLDGSSQDLV